MKKNGSQNNLSEWHGRFEDAPEYPDMDYWLKCPFEEKFRITEEMIIFAHKLKGEDVPRFSRTIETFSRGKS